MEDLLEKPRAVVHPQYVDLQTFKTWSAQVLAVKFL